MSKTAQSNYTPKKISAGAVLERIKDGTHIPAHEKDVYGNSIPMAKNPRYSNDPMNKGEDVHPEVKSISNLIDKFEKINAKNNCVRVRFYDWFADYLDRMAGKMRERAFNITNPCAISLPPSKEKKVESKKVVEMEPAKDRSKPDTISMKLPDEEVKKIVPDLTPDHDLELIAAQKTAEKFADIMVKAGNPPETFKITPDIQRAIEDVAKAEVEYERTLAYKEKK
jgi:hypothetical protein